MQDISILRQVTDLGQKAKLGSRNFARFARKRLGTQLNPNRDAAVESHVSKARDVEYLAKDYCFNYFPEALTPKVKTVGPNVSAYSPGASG